MKLRLLNASHQAIAYSGHLSGYVYAHEAASDPVFVEFLLGYMNNEARPTLGDVPGVDLDDYVLTLVARFANPAIRDTLARLCAFSSDRIPKWVLPVLRENLAAGGEITRTTAIVASWASTPKEPTRTAGPSRSRTLCATRSWPGPGQAEDPLAFVRNPQLFGDLVDSTEFARCYEQCLRSFHAVGARRTLQDINET